MARYIIAIVDLQFGSTGKGQIAGTMGLQWKPDTVVTAWGPNAGHTFRNGEFQGVSTMLASSATAPSVQSILIGPGSVVDLTKLADEIKDRGSRHMGGKSLIIHPQAAILRESDSAAERHSLERIGSTMKGTAEAHIRKIRRQDSATAYKNAHEVLGVVGEACFEVGMSIVISSTHYDRAVDRSARLLVEGAQGYSLGLHTDFYPHCTGRDVSTAQMFADCRIPWPGAMGTRPLVIGTARTFPIRVANRYRDEPIRGAEFPGHPGGAIPTERVMVGSSGGHYRDQEETTWEAIGQPVELTTVTKLPRRVFTFSMQQVKEAVRVCGVDLIALTFCDYLAGHEAAESLAEDVSSETGAPVRLMSFGPDIVDIRHRTTQGGLIPLKDTQFPTGEWPHGY